MGEIRNKAKRYYSLDTALSQNAFYTVLQYSLISSKEIIRKNNFALNGDIAYPSYKGTRLATVRCYQKKIKIHDVSEKLKNIAITIERYSHFAIFYFVFL